MCDVLRDGWLAYDQLVAHSALALLRVEDPQRCDDCARYGHALLHEDMSPEEALALRCERARDMQARIDAARAAARDDAAATHPEVEAVAADA